ncbi:hypothetical protein GCM10023168_26010 [Fodinibacter luteus]|uniref:Secreted protein n=1 Tax=Fodinibacter luteus TaxID=552064 RepID=A0ABP8KJA2_9MICO
MIAVWMPVTSVPTSAATVAMETFMTELSSVMRNCAAARVASTPAEAAAAVAGALAPVVVLIGLPPVKSSRPGAG